MRGWIELETIDNAKIFINPQNVAYIQKRDEGSFFVTFNYASTETEVNYVIVKGDCRYVAQFLDDFLVF